VHPVGIHDRGHTPPRPFIVAVIPSRYDSTRLPGKALAEIGGRPMVEHVYRRAAAVPGIAQVLVATDDARIRDAVEAFGGTAVMTSPAHRTGTDRLAEVAAGLHCDIVVNVQGDEPLIEPAAIALAIAPVASSDGDVAMATLRRRVDRLEELLDPNVVKVVVDRQGNALYFSRAPVPHGRSAGGHFVPACTFRHIGLYVYRRERLLALAALPPTPLEVAESLEQLRALEHGFPVRTVETTYAAIGVDTPDDLEHVRRLCAASPLR
jgi:3-deoxy-manno-octulosonate cytidylyltransferase (CMP-KDO synthetase)